MTVRRLIDNDYSFGNSEADIISGLPEIMQKCQTSLMQLQGEWFLDGRDGVDWGAVLGHKPDLPLLSSTIRKTLMGVTGVIGVTNIDVLVIDRHVKLSALISTQYGQSEFTQSLNTLELLKNDATN